VAAAAAASAAVSACAGALLTFAVFVQGDRWQPPQAGHDAETATSSGNAGSGGSVRQPGAMSALLDSTQRRGRGRGRPRQGQRGGDDDGKFESTQQGGGDVPAHLMDTPHNLLTSFTYALRSAADPSAPAIPLKVRRCCPCAPAGPGECCRSMPASAAHSPLCAVRGRLAAKQPFSP
jgi:hypothetical protein